MILATLALASLPAVPLAPPQASAQDCPKYGSDGRGCAGAGGYTPKLELKGNLSRPTDLTLELDGALGGAGVILIVGGSPTSVSYPGGCTLTTSPDQFLPTVTASGSGPGNGSVSVPVPFELALTSGTLFVQAAVIDSSAAAGFVLSNRLEIKFDASCVATSLLIKAFSGSNTAAADAAYQELLNRGTKGINALMNLASTSAADLSYAGLGFYHPHSSRTRLSPAPLSTMALYVVEGILHKSAAPYHSPELHGLYGSSLDPDADGLAAYQSWWASNSGLTLDQLRAVPGALDFTSLTWTGSLLAPVSGFLGSGDGIEITGSETPYKVVPGTGACVEGTYGPGEYDYVGPPGGAEPYNCLSWALGCQTDRWTEPGGGTTMDDIMTGMGYTQNPVTTTGNQVKLIYHSRKGTCEDGEWVHAMKQEPGGWFSSKNGANTRHENIVDCSIFLSIHYPTPPGYMTVIKTYSM